MHRAWILLLTVLAALPSSRARGAVPQQAAIDHFENQVRPLLVLKCGECHGAEEQQSELRLDSVEGILSGGEKGPLFIAGQPDQSLLISAVRRSGELAMPPEEKLSENEIEILVEWVRNGAILPAAHQPVRHAPDGGPLFTEEDKSHWAFQPLDRTGPPEVNGRAWPRTELDRFILAGLEARGLPPAPAADKRTLIRRVTFDLIGLPPTPEEVAAFLADDSPDAFAQLVERLLASRHYGERWGRRWLDVARYADSNGLDENMVYENAFRYRDYVIAALNKDKPYDLFVHEQLAGDLLPPTDDPAIVAERTIATGFLCLGPKGLREVDATKMEMDIIDDQVATIGKAFLGLTLECARCHDHKFDPIPTKDYYSLAGIFKSTKTMAIIVDKRGKGDGHWLEQPIALDPARTIAYRREKTVHDQAVRETQAKLPAEIVSILDAAEDDRDDEQRNELTIYTEQDPQNKAACEQYSQLISSAPTPPPMGSAMSVTDGEIQDVRVHIRGSHLSLGESVSRLFPRILAGRDQTAIDSSASGRLQLAQWLTDVEDGAGPLVARVIVNRIWQGHFGRGLVATPDNFGKLGEVPSHPKLLDWLAGSLVESGWSIKALHRLILLSSTYRMSTRYDSEAAHVDPQNLLYWRMNRRRLEAEAIRDALLFVGGQLDLQMGGSLLGLKNREYVTDANTFEHRVKYDNNRRAVYQPVIRNKLYDLFQVFDFPNPSLVNGRRSSTTVAPQALLLLNSPLAGQCAGGMAERLEVLDADDTERVRLGYEIAFSRPPTDEELHGALEYLARYTEGLGSTQEDADRRLDAWQSLCQALLICNDFFYVD